MFNVKDHHLYLQIKRIGTEYMTRRRQQQNDLINISKTVPNPGRYCTYIAALLLNIVSYSRPFGLHTTRVQIAMWCAADAATNLRPSEVRAIARARSYLLLGL